MKKGIFSIVFGTVVEKKSNKRTGKLLTRAAAFGRFGQHIKEKFDDYCSWPDC